MFYVVRFLDDFSLHVICSQWFIRPTEVQWRNFTSTTERDNAVRRGEGMPPNAQTRRVRVVDEFGMFFLYCHIFQTPFRMPWRESTPI